MSKTPKLNLGYLQPAQAQKHVTVNEALLQIDAAVHCTVRALLRNDPPASPEEGDAYIVGQAPTGGWEGRAGRFAVQRNGGWAFETPRPGWRVFNLSDERLFVLTASAGWTALGGGAGSHIQNAELFGLGTAADAANPFAAKLNSALWTAREAAEGGTGDLRYVMNKPAAGRDLGYIFQTNYVTRAIAGLFGSNRFRIAVSNDGTNFQDGLIVANTTGIVDQPRLPRFKAFTDFDNHGPLNTWVKIGINNADYNEQGAFDAATGRFIAPAAGTYMLGGSLMFKLDQDFAARMQCRLVQNGGLAAIRGSFGEAVGPYASNLTVFWFQTIAPLAAGDTVELQGRFRAASGIFASNNTTFWGYKVG
ncbi:DUF2793 domain-containing protein [soil metagenome]